MEIVYLRDVGLGDAYLRDANPRSVSTKSSYLSNVRLRDLESQLERCLFGRYQLEVCLRGKCMLEEC
jgi:hypothetical protein